MFVKPATGRAARDPVTRALLPVDGADVPSTAFWRRRVRDKDVTIVEQVEPTAPPAPEMQAEEH